MKYFTLWVFERDRGHFAGMRHEAEVKVMWGSNAVTQWTLDSLRLKGTVREGTREEVESYLHSSGGRLVDIPIRESEPIDYRRRNFSSGLVAQP